MDFHQVKVGEKEHFKIEFSGKRHLFSRTAMFPGDSVEVVGDYESYTRSMPLRAFVVSREKFDGQYLYGLVMYSEIPYAVHKMMVRLARERVELVERVEQLEENLANAFEKMDAPGVAA